MKRENILIPPLGKLKKTNPNHHLVVTLFIETMEMLHARTQKQHHRLRQDAGVNRKGDANPAHLPRLGTLLCT
jgi:hypothetical protein